MRCSVLCLVLLCSQFSVAQRSAGDDFFEQGKNLLEKKQTDKSLKAFDRARTEYLKEKNWYRYFVSTQTISMYYQDTGKGEASEKMLLDAIDHVPADSPENISIQANLHDNLAYTYLYSLQNADKAIQAYSESIKFCKQSGTSTASDLALEYSGRGNAYFTRHSFEESVKDYLSAIEYYEKETGVEKRTLADVHYNTGTCYLSMANFDNAIAQFTRSLEILSKEDEKELKANIHSNLSIAQEEKGEFSLALQHIEKAKALNEELYGKDADHYGQCFINSGKIHSSMGDYENALHEYQEVLAIYAKTPPEDMEAMVTLMLNVGSLTDQLGFREQGRVVYEETLKLVRSLPGDNSMLLSDVYAKMAAVAFDDGEYDRSLEYNFKALDIIQTKKANDPISLALIYNNIGTGYDMVKEPVLALQYKNQGLDLYRKMHGESHPDVAMAISNIGLTYEISEDYDKALEFLYKALDMRIKELGQQDEEVGTNYLNIGIMLLKKSEVNKAIENLEKAVAIYDPERKFEFKATAYNALGVAYLMKDDQVRASACYQKAVIANVRNFDNPRFDVLPENPEYLDYYQWVVSCTGKADVFTLKGDVNSLVTGMKHLDAADKVLKEKAILMDNPNDRLKLAQLNFFLIESGMNLVNKLYALTRDEKHLEKAFYFSERNKANELYASIKASKAAGVARVPDAILKRQREISYQVQGTEQQLATASEARDQAVITKLKSKLFDLSNESRALEQQVAKSSSAYASAVGQRTLPAWPEVRTSLGARTALVSYIITDSAKYILIGTSARLVMKSIDPHTDLEKMVRGFRNQVKYQAPALNATSRELYKVIWKPVDDVLGQSAEIENIIVIPDGPLSLLPFEALEADGKYLLERYNLRYHVSCALMLQPAKTEVPKKPSLIAFAPVFADEETNFVNKSCERAAQKTDSTSRSFSLDGSYIMPLPATEVEVQEIYRALSVNDPFSKYFLKKDANEELIKKGELGKYDYIHFATHGIVNSQYPELSGLLLAQNKQSPEDGILYTGEIFGLDLKAQLVTLSACETALGKRVEGEGVRGLTSAFLVAGARTVVVSLWKVADESTAKLMISFYNQLLSGKDKASALREAKLSLLRESKYAHPFYWAPFVQIGSN